MDHFWPAQIWPAQICPEMLAVGCTRISISVTKCPMVLFPKFNITRVSELRKLINATKCHTKSPGWCSGESTGLPPMWPGFDFQSWHHIWIEFVGSLLSSERVSSGYSGFLLASKTNL